MNKLKELLEKYGRLTLLLHLGMYALTFVIMFCIIQLGWREAIVDLMIRWVGDEYVEAGTWVVVFAATKVTQPLRIMLLVLIVPPLHRYLERRNNYSDTAA